ncbi:MAG: F0F1 ATP synthase subunit B [Thermodesulfobacteriota bacterium]
MQKNVKWRKLGLGALAAVALMGVAATVYASGGGDGPIVSAAKWKDFGWRVMNFAALVIILNKFLKKPLLDGLKGRQQGIREEFEELETKRAEAEAQYQEYAGRLSGLDAELEKMVETAIASGETEKEKILAQANEAAEQIKRQAEMAVVSAVALAKKDLKDEVAEQAAVMAEEIIKKNLNADDQKNLVSAFMAKAGGAA